MMDVLETTASLRLDAEHLRRLAGRVTLAGGAREGIIVHMPATGEALGEVPRGTIEDVREALRRARVAQEDWAHRTVAERAAPFLRFHDLVLERQDEAGRCAVLEWHLWPRHMLLMV